MSLKPTAKLTAPTTTSSKKAASAKITGKTKANYLLMASSSHLVSKLYGFSTKDKYTMSFDTEGMLGCSLRQGDMS